MKSFRRILVDFMLPTADDNRTRQQAMHHTPTTVSDGVREVQSSGMSYYSGYGQLSKYACRVIALRPGLTLPLRNEGKRKAAAAKQPKDHTAESKLTSRRARTRQTICGGTAPATYY